MPRRLVENKNGCGRDLGPDKQYSNTGGKEDNVYSGWSWSSSSLTSIIIRLFFFFNCLFGCARSLVGSGGIFSWGRWDLSWGRWGFVPWPGINPGAPCIGSTVLAPGPPGRSLHQHSYLVSPSRKFKVKWTKKTCIHFEFFFVLFWGFLTFTEVQAASQVERGCSPHSFTFLSPGAVCVAFRFIFL